jgi:hypothetical protein
METADTLQKKEILSTVGKGMGPEKLIFFFFFMMVLKFDLRALCLLGKNIIISEVSQVQNANLHLFSLICGIKINTSKSNIIYS